MEPPQRLTATRTALLAWSTYTIHTLLVIFAALSNVWPLQLSMILASSTGFALMVAGLVLYGAGAAAMHSLARMSGRRADQLITSGVYRFTRHPQLVGWALILLGIALWGRSWLALLLAALYLVGIIFLMPVEERKLIELYGEEYRNYQIQTPRFFGWSKR